VPLSFVCHSRAGREAGRRGISESPSSRSLRGTMGSSPSGPSDSAASASATAISWAVPRSTGSTVSICRIHRVSSGLISASASAGTKSGKTEKNSSRSVSVLISAAMSG
jgi:hypothetical protein